MPEKNYSPYLVGQETSQHPAVVSGQRLNATTSLPTAIQALQRKRTFRLKSAGPDRINIIAKLRLNDRMVQRRLYSDALPHLQVATASCYGSIRFEEAHYQYWLLLQDVGDEQYSPSSEEVRWARLRRIIR
jgi:hypothetical protein